MGKLGAQACRRNSRQQDEWSQGNRPAQSAGKEFPEASSCNHVYIYSSITYYYIVLQVYKYVHIEHIHMSMFSMYIYNNTVHVIICDILLISGFSQAVWSPGNVPW